MRSECRQHGVVQAAGVVADELPDDGGDLPQLFLGRQPGGRALAVTGGQLVLETGHPDLEELVEVRTEDPQELEPLQQWRPLILSLVQDPAIELQPRKLAVDVQRGAAQVGGRLNDGGGLWRQDVGHGAESIARPRPGQTGRSQPGSTAGIRAPFTACSPGRPSPLPRWRGTD